MRRYLSTRARTKQRVCRLFAEQQSKYLGKSYPRLFYLVGLERDTQPFGEILQQQEEG